MKESFDIPSHKCPSCGHKLDQTTSAYGENKPTPGCYSMCIACGFISVFGEDLVARMPTPKEQEEILHNKQVLMAQVVRSSLIGDRIKRRDKRNKKHDTNTKKTTEKTDV